MSPIFLQHIGIKGAMLDCFHDVVGRMEEKTSNDSTRGIPQFDKSVIAAGVRGTEEDQT